MEGISSRVLGWAGAEPDELRDPKIRAAWIVVSLHVTSRLTLASWFAGVYWVMPLPWMLFVLGLGRPFLRPVAAVLALVQCVRFALTYPDVSNHYLIECLAMMVFAAVDLDREEERALCLRALCWLAAVVLLMSGVQKVLHGSYFRGQYLAYMVANTDRFSDFFSPILSQADLDHLHSLRNATDALQFRFDQPVGPMPGPYRVDSWMFIAVANAIWIGEILVPLGLLWKRTRRWALIGALLLMAGIAGSSREMFFDTLFVNLLLLFAVTPVNRKLLPLSLASYVVYLLGGFGVLPLSFVW